MGACRGQGAVEQAVSFIIWPYLGSLSDCAANDRALYSTTCYSDVGERRENGIVECSVQRKHPARNAVTLR